MGIYKSKQHYLKIPSICIEISDLNTIYDVLLKLNDEAISYELNHLKSTSADESFDEEETESLLKKIIVLSMEVWGANGEYILTDSVDAFKKSSLPKSITKITFDNSLYYKQQMNQLLPKAYLRLVLDFNRPQIFDFLSIPTEGTYNDSLLQIISENDTWVEGGFTRINNILKDNKTYRSWIHQKNVYNFLLWLTYIPMIIFYIMKYDSLLKNNLFSGVSVPSLLIIYIIALLFSLNIFRLLYNYARWLFPYTELSDVKTASKKHRGFFFFLLSACASPLIYDLFKLLSK